MTTLENVGKKIRTAAAELLPIDLLKSFVSAGFLAQIFIRVQGFPETFNFLVTNGTSTDRAYAQTTMMYSYGTLLFGGATMCFWSEYVVSRHMHWVWREVPYFVALIGYFVGYLLIANLVGENWYQYDVTRYICADFLGGAIAFGIVYRKREGENWATAILQPFFYFFFVLMTFMAAQNDFQQAWSYAVYIQLFVFFFVVLWLLFFSKKFTYATDYAEEIAAEEFFPYRGDWKTWSAMMRYGRGSAWVGNAYFQLIYFVPFVFIPAHMTQAGCNQTIQYNAALLGGFALIAGAVVQVLLTAWKQMKEASWVAYFLNNLVVLVMHGFLVGSLYWLSVSSNTTCNCGLFYAQTVMCLFALSSINWWNVVMLDYCMFLYCISAAWPPFLSQLIVTNERLANYPGNNTQLGFALDTAGMWNIYMILAAVLFVPTLWTMFVEYMRDRREMGSKVDAKSEDKIPLKKGSRSNSSFGQSSSFGE